MMAANGVVMRLQRIAPAVLVGLAATAVAFSDDTWPRLWGPSGDGKADARTRLPGGAALQVREAWRRPIGSGFSGIAVAAGRVFTAFADGGQDYAVAFDAVTGRELWRTSLGETYRGHDGSKDGPSSTPTLDGGRVFLVGPRGVLVALNAETGAVAWRHDLTTEFGVPAPYWGFATSPLVVGRHLVVQGGGEKNGLIAFDRASGALAWSASHSKAAGYSSPVLATLGGVPQVVVLANDLVYAVRADDGALLWSHPSGWTEEAIRPPTPLPGDRVLIAGTGETRLIELRKEGERFAAKALWTTPRLKNSLSPTVVHDGHVYGFGSSYLVCLDLATAEVVWRHKVYAGSLILVDGHLLVLGAESGELRIGRVSPQGYQERLKALVFNAGATSVTGPAFADGRVFMRNVEEIVAVDLFGR